MSELTAYQAAVLADDVYALTKLPDIKRAMTYLNDTHGDVFTFTDEQILKAKTGGPGFIKTQTAFGFVLLGKGSLQGQAFFIFRGTQYLGDWLTNFNVGISRSNSGQPIHDGFNRAFKSMEVQLRHFMGSIIKSNAHTIHCIGHSLGGALATICGEWIYSSYGRKPYIYTFGSPRVGLMGFVDRCSSQIGSDRIFRAFHKTDIVPCIPPWPYLHTPNSGREYYLPSPGVVPMAEYHGMDHYITSVEDKDWKTLAGLRRDHHNDRIIELWLKQSGPVGGFTITGIEKINNALIYVLKKCVNGVNWAVSHTFSSSFTLMDQLAFILNKGINLAETVSSWVVFLIRKIMQMLGMSKVVEKVDLTHNFIRAIFIRLQTKISNFTKGVLNQVLVKGRAI